jgi:hypothetical protein
VYPDRSPTFRENVLLSSYRSKSESGSAHCSCCLFLAGVLLHLESVSPSEDSVKFHLAVRRHIPDSSILHSCKKSKIRPPSEHADMSINGKDMFKLMLCERDILKSYVFVKPDPRFLFKKAEI